MLKRFLEEVINLTVGRQAEEIVKLLHTKKHVNEFILAKKLDLTINQTRNVLYKISDHGLVSSIRKKDKKKGWYTYFWKIEVLKSLEFLKAHMINKRSQFEKQINSRETKRFYVCSRCNIELTEENALLQDFVCNECGSIFELKDNVKVIREMKKNFDKLDTDIGLIEDEIKKEQDKSDKMKLREVKSEERSKKKKRAEGRAIRKLKNEASKKAKEKATKKSSKKVVKKKPKTVKKPLKKKVTKVGKVTKKKTPKDKKKKSLLSRVGLKRVKKSKK